MPPKKGSRMPIEVRAELERLLIEEWGPTAIYNELDRKFKSRAPSLRNIQRIASQFKPRDRSGVWSVREADPDTAKLVLETLAVVMMRTEGRIREVTNGVAEWIVKVETICPDFPLFDVYHFAWLYNARESNNESTGDLDAYLAFKPWQSEDRHRQYHHAIDRGWIDIAPAVLIVHDDGFIESSNDLQWRDVLDMNLEALKRDAKLRKGESNHE